MSKIIDIKEEDVIGFDALYESMIRCMEGVLWKDTVARFVYNSQKELYKLSEELRNNTYIPKNLYKFKVYYPKEREIISISFRDRVYQRSLNDNALYPIMSKIFIYDNCACQKNKGTMFALGRFKAFLEKFYRENGINGYILKCDIKKYYNNIRHQDANLMFKKYLERYDDWIYNRVVRVLDFQYNGDIGYNPGSQMVQILGISLLNEMDHIIKEQFPEKVYYLRYMDDFILIHKSKEYLKKCKSFIENYLRAKFNLLLNSRKTIIQPINNSIRFLGYNHKLLDNGKIIIMVNKENVQHEKRKIDRMKKLVNNNIMTYDKYINNYKSWRAHALYGNSYKLLKYMDDYIILEKNNTIN